MRRFDSDRPSPSEAISSAFLTVLEIVERLAHAHHDDVGDLAALGRHDGAVTACRGRGKSPSRSRAVISCVEDLLGRQVAHQLLRAGVAERAGQRAADLRGDAQRAAAFLGDIDGLDLDRPAGAARRKAEQPFAGAVVRDLLLDDLRPGDREMSLERGAQLLGDVEHLARSRRRRAHRASATAAGRASSPGAPARCRRRPAPRPARPGRGRSARPLRLWPTRAASAARVVSSLRSSETVMVQSCLRSDDRCGQIGCAAHITGRAVQRHAPAAQAGYQRRQLEIGCAHLFAGGDRIAARPKCPSAKTRSWSGCRASTWRRPSSSSRPSWRRSAAAPPRHSRPRHICRLVNMLNDLLPTVTMHLGTSPACRRTR